MSALPRRRTVMLLAAAVVAAVVAGSTSATAAPPPPRFGAGSSGAGDPYFPLAGNGGIDVIHYDLDLDYTPPQPEPAPLTGSLVGVATIDLVATAGIDRFNLDLRDLTATGVTVNGKSATFTQGPNELTITPRKKLRAGEAARVVVAYSGTTARPTDIEGVLYGWITTRDGAVVVSEPDGAATWFPANDHPTDKSTYTFEITVPEDLVAVANGLLDGSTTSGGFTTWLWNAPDPMAAYLATATIGDFELDQHTTPGGIPIIDAIDPTRTTAQVAALALTDDMIDFFADRFGPYPFVSYGAIVDDDTVGYALETQTRSFLGRSASEGTAAHELAHQWMGDHVSVARWADIWLNEGWATYGEWLWSEHRGTSTAQADFDDVMRRPATDATWTSVLAEPGPFGLFTTPVYDRGAALLHALRGEVGDEAFFELASEWVARFGGGTATTADFIALSEEVSGQDLADFFQVWAYTPTKPTSW